VLDSLPSQVHKDCSHALFWICGRQTLLPQSLTILPHYDPTKDPLYRGGFADVWKGQCEGKEVAVKVLRISSLVDPDQMRRVGGTPTH